MLIIDPVILLIVISLLISLLSLYACMNVEVGLDKAHVTLDKQPRQFNVSPNSLSSSNSHYPRQAVRL